MSLKYLLVCTLSSFLLGCNNNPTAENRFADLSETEKDSLTELYHLISMDVRQPSEIHRRFKDTALMISPDHVEYRQRLSYSYKKTGEHIQAMKILNNAVARDIKDNKTNALQYRAWSLLYFYRDYKGTIEDVDLINKMQSNNNYTICHGEPCDNLKGQALYKLGRYKEAIKVFKDILEVEEKKGWDPLANFHVYFYMARCYTELKNYDRAIEIYKLQIGENEKFTEAHYQLGKIYNVLGDKENAQKYLGSALNLYSEGYKMGEPYYEAFDEVFLYQIEGELEKI